MLPEIVVEEIPVLADMLASIFESERRRAIERHGFFAVALPGGSVATTLFPRLAALDCSWTEFFWGDERSVPADHAESNYNIARTLWLAPAGIPDRRVHRMPAETAELDAAAEAYAGELRRVLGSPARLDVVLLGVGPDGHVCSLFPGHALLREERRLVAAVTDAPKPPPRRLTLTLPALAAAERVVIAALGASKAAVLREAVEEAVSALPLALVLARARRATLLMDPQAASLVQASA
jgi:6-phosphogluconolactonase